MGIINAHYYAPSEDIEDAITVAEALGIEYEIIHVDDLIAPFKDLCIHTKDKGNIDHRDIANANLKAQIGVILYYHANDLNRLVVGTGEQNRTFSWLFHQIW